MSSETFLSAVVSPGAMPRSCWTASSNCGDPFDVARRSHADHAGVLAGGLQREEVIEGRDAVSAAQRHAQRHGYIAQRLGVEISERFLHGVQRLNQSALMLALAPYGGVDQLPALVLIWRSWLGKV